MPVTRLWVEGKLDAELLPKLLGGSVEVKRKGGKYGLPGLVVRERDEMMDPTLRSTR